MTIRAGQTVSNHDQLNSNLRSILPNQRKLLYNLLSQYQTFTQFISAQSCDGSGRIGTVENLHNPIHNANFPGHMSPSGAAAFDPMFWMHHAWVIFVSRKKASDHHCSNVDRQIALYQAIFPDTYLGNCTAGTATFTISEGDFLDASSREYLHSQDS